MGHQNTHKQVVAVVSAKPVVRVQQKCVACHKPSTVRMQILRSQPSEKTVKVMQEKHVVTENECLSVIAWQHGLGSKNWSKIQKANPAIKNPHKIFIGQVLIIPTINVPAPTGTKVSAVQKTKQPQSSNTGNPVIKTTAGIFLWTIAGGNPFGKRNHRKALGQLPTDDQELKAALLKQYNDTKPVLNEQYIKPGTDFEWILFGNYQWVHTARWSGKTSLTAFVWPEFEHKGKIWTITLTPLCNNLEIISRPVPVSTPLEPPPVVQPPPMEEVPPQIVTPPAIPPEIPKAEVPPPKVDKPCCQWTPDYKGALFIAPRWGVNYPSKDRQMIYGGEMDFFPGYCGEKNRTVYPGISVKGVGWDGQFGEKNGGLLNFNGNQIVYGGVLEVRKPNDLSILHLRYGKQEGKAWNDTGYLGREENELLNFEARQLHKTGQNWPSEVQVAGSANLDIGGRKKSSVNGKALTAAQDPRRDQSQYALMGQASLYASDKVEPLVGLVVDHTPGAKVTGVEPYVGAKVLEEQFEPSARYRVNIGKDDPGDTMGANLVWNFDRTFKKATQYVIKTWSNRGVAEAQTVEPVASSPVETIIPTPVNSER